MLESGWLDISRTNQLVLSLNSLIRYAYDADIFGYCKVQVLEWAETGEVFTEIPTY